MKVDPMERIASRILVVRGQRVMLDADLADVYGVSANALNQAVKRNPKRFPEDFVFQLNGSETVRLRSQIAASHPRHALRIYPWVFTDHGALMAAYVLHSNQAIQVSMHVMRASVRLREMVAADKWLAKLLDELERGVLHYDLSIRDVVKVLRELASHPHHPIPPPSRGRGHFHSGPTKPM